MQVFLKRFDGGLRRGARRECTVEAHGLETLFDLVKRLLADYDIAADVKQDAFKACFIALFTHAAAVQFALAIERGNDDCIRVGLDCSGDVFFLRNHHAEVDNLKPCIRECMVEDFVADSMHICADYADDKLLLVAHSFCPRNSYFLFHK